MNFYRSMGVGFCFLLGLSAVWGCDDYVQNLVEETPAVCIDGDKDGYGLHCTLGPDCDDTNSQLNYSCDCDAMPMTGCACDAQEPVACFEADPSFLSKGVCTQGVRYCQAGAWSNCIGQVLPTQERCDNLDNNCDGNLNNGIICNDCGPGCQEQTLDGDHNGGFVVNEDNSQGIALDSDGNLSLKDPSGERIPHNFIYIANSDEGTVSKINAETGKEEARYLSALYSPDPRNKGNADANGNAPSRTAVDFNGDVWVANRAFGKQGTVTKIAHEECADINGNGKIDTSHDVDGDGRISLQNPDEFLGEEDECIIFTVDVGGIDGVPRAIALDAGGDLDTWHGNAWVGAYKEQRVYKLNYKTGEVEDAIDIGLRPYGAAIDSFGQLWLTDVQNSRIVRVNTKAGTADNVIELGSDCLGSYGIAVDTKGRVWLGGYQWEGACRYDPSDGSTFAVPISVSGRGRGVAVDANGFVWVAHDDSKVGKLTRFKADDASQMHTYEFPAGNGQTIGVGIDFNGKVWGINRTGNSACRVDPDTSTIDCFPTGKGPYTYSDFTGYALQHITAPPGTYRHTFEGCANKETSWQQISWDAVVPGGTTVQIFIRAAESEAALPQAQRHGPFVDSPQDLKFLGITGRYLMVEVILTTEFDKSPRFSAMSVQWSCYSSVTPD